MRIATLTFAFLLVAAGVTAQESQPEQPQPVPDYSRDTLLRLFADASEDDDEQLEMHIGVIDYRTARARWRFGYLPFFAPFQGSLPWLNSHRWPDPFILTGTEIPQTSRTWRDQRAMSAELRRLERRIRDTSSIRVDRD